MTAPIIPAGSPLLAEDLDDFTAAVNGPAAWGLAWSPWTPTHTNLTVGNGTVTARYLAMGKTIFYRWKFVLGSTSAVATGPRFTLPAQPFAGYTDTIMGDGYAWDNGLAAHRVAARAQSLSGNGTVELVYFSGGGAASFVSATVPVTFGSTDSLSVVGMYERS